MKRFFKIFLLFAFCFIIFGFTKTVQANSIEKISMNIYIDKDGDASVTEVWNCQASSGTEVYHPYYNLGKSKITNLTVSDSGVDYQTLSSWSTSGSLQSKAQKCGINKVSNGVELCWGISNYGSHTYTVKYTITNFIADLNDSQMIYWTLIPYDFSNYISDVYIKIHADEAFPDTTPVWGYGNYGGTAYVYDGYIEMQPQNGLGTDEYMTVLVQFPKGTFNANNSLNHDFDYYYEMAEDGAEHYENNDSNLFVTIIEVIFQIAMVLFVPTIILIVIVTSGQGNGRSSVLHKPSNTKFSKKDIEYFRDIPCNNDIFRAFYVGYNYNILKRDSYLLGAIILKWIKDSVVKVEHKESSKVFKKDDISIIFNTSSLQNFESKKEKEIFDILYSASKDGVLKNNEFKDWCELHYKTVFNWFDDILDEQRDKLVNENLIMHEEKTILKFFVKHKYSSTPELRQEALNLAGLKKYLKEYTLIKNREPIEVNLFENYLIFAQLMGIADKVAKDFKDLYPDIIEQSDFDSYNNIAFVNTWASNGMTYVLSAKSKAEGYSSGGGGFSSGGGGGGSFGGGGGGGGFR